MIRTAYWSQLTDAEPAAGTLEVAQLVRRALGGDSGAFECIILRYERRVVSLATKLLGRPEDAQDAAQEVFLRVYKYLHRLDLEKPIEPWLMRMTVNVARDIGRKRQARLEHVSGVRTGGNGAGGERTRSVYRSCCRAAAAPVVESIEQPSGKRTDRTDVAGSGGAFHLRSGGDYGVFGEHGPLSNQPGARPVEGRDRLHDWRPAVTCAYSRETLALFIEDDLDAGRAEGVRDHVSHCESCRQIANN